MQKSLSKYKWLIAAWLMLFGCNISSALAYEQTIETASWGYEPVCGDESSANARPTYEFQSTSAYVSSDNGTASGLKLKGVRRTTDDPWGIPTDDPIGVIPDPVPVGEPLILLVLALLYFCYKRKKSADRNA